MNIETKALIAMSGGVDSSVAAALMLEQAIQCTGVTFRLFRENRCTSLADTFHRNENDAKTVALALGIEHHELDFTDEFENEVIRRFVETYEAGETPNPCIECNRRVKFNLSMLRGKLRCKMKEGLGDFDIFVTGHYARITHDPVSGRFLLRKALDTNKDQSYVLYCLSQEQLEKARFPLGELSKHEVRKIAEEKKLVSAGKPDSQDICFVPDGDYGSFIEKHTGKTYPEGDIIDPEGKIIGRHRGVIRYTVGQRRGLGVAANIPVYVTAKSAADNTVTLGPDSALFSKALTAKDINLIACADLKKPMRVMVKTRYLQTAQSAVAEQTGENSLHIEFDEPQRAITPGQAAVMYDGDVVVGGGTIE
ncbi:MAG: tRNA 2-thiouridine(34) synthase MnmA [Treponema sp.]|nr:tRNA 2-thiouridine(34) synthase MnmA [Treponema sp.]